MTSVLSLLAEMCIIPTALFWGGLALIAIAILWFIYIMVLNEAKRLSGLAAGVLGSLCILLAATGGICSSTGNRLEENGYCKEAK
jgi:hypothetical protein